MKFPKSTCVRTTAPARLRLASLFFPVLCILIFSAQRLYAQNAALTGLITDPSGAVIQHAQVTLTDERTSAVWKASTNDRGLYSVPNIAPGKYTLDVDAPGFKHYKQADINVDPAQAVAFDAHLQVGSAAQQVTVNGATVGYVATNGLSATKTDTPLIETPQSISVVTRQQIIDQNSQTISEALNYSAGIATGTTGGYDPRYDQILIRGFSESSLGDYRDGLREYGGSFSVFATEPYGLERIDVLRGPTSVVYGQNSPGGMINRYSKRPTNQPVGEVALNLGNYDRYQGNFDLGGPVPGISPLTYRLTGLFRQSNTSFLVAPDNRQFVAPAFTWQPSPKTSLTALTSFEHDQTGVGVVAQAANGTATNVFLDDPTYSHWQRKQYLAGYQFAHQLNDRAVVRNNFRFGWMNIDYRSLDQLSISGDTISRYAIGARTGQRDYADDSQLEYHVRTGKMEHTLLGGFDFFRDTLDFTENLGLAPSLNIVNPVYGQTIPLPTPSYPSSIRNYQPLNQFGLYGQDQTKYKRLVIVLSGRNDWANSATINLKTPARTYQKDSALSGRAGVLYMLGHGLSPYVGYSTSFTPNTGSNFAGQAYIPTTGQQLEGGLKYQPDHFRGYFTVTGFRLVENNVLVLDPNHTSFDTQTGQIRSAGLELEGHVDLGLGLSVVGQYTYDDVENTKSYPVTTVGKTPVGVPTNLTSLWTNYSVRHGRLAGLGLGGGVRYTGMTYSNTTNTLLNPSFLFGDLATHYDRERWTFSLNVHNVSDIRTATCFNTTCTATLGRVVLGQMRYHWN